MGNKKSTREINKKILKIFPVLLISVLIISAIFGEYSSNKKEIAKKEAAKQKTINIAKERKINSIPQISAWDGVAVSIKKYLKNQDIEYLDAGFITKLSNGLWLQRVRIKGKNKFGGEVIQNIGFIINGTGKNSTVEIMEEFSKVMEEIGKQNIKIVNRYDLNGNEIK